MLDAQYVLPSQPYHTGIEGLLATVRCGRDGQITLEKC